VGNLFLSIFPKYGEDDLFSDKPKLKTTLTKCQKSNDLSPEEAIEALNNLLDFIKETTPSLDISQITSDITSEHCNDTLDAVIKEFEENIAYPLVFRKSLLQEHYVESPLVKKLCKSSEVIKMNKLMRDVLSDMSGATKPRSSFVALQDTFSNAMPRRPSVFGGSSALPPPKKSSVAEEEEEEKRPSRTGSYNPFKKTYTSNPSTGEQREESRRGSYISGLFKKKAPAATPPTNPNTGERDVPRGGSFIGGFGPITFKKKAPEAAAPSSPPLPSPPSSPPPPSPLPRIASSEESLLPKRSPVKVEVIQLSPGGKVVARSGNSVG
jgi:hypothetical protein